MSFRKFTPQLDLEHPRQIYVRSAFKGWKYMVKRMKCCVYWNQTLYLIKKFEVGPGCDAIRWTMERKQTICKEEAGKGWKRPSMTPLSFSPACSVEGLWVWMNYVQGVE
jgi:hypothetical protein